MNRILINNRYNLIKIKGAQEGDKIYKVAFVFYDDDEKTGTLIFKDPDSDKKIKEVNFIFTTTRYHKVYDIQFEKGSIFEDDIPCQINCNNENEIALVSNVESHDPDLYVFRRLN